MLTVAICAWENAKPQLRPHHLLCPFLQHIKAHRGKPNVITVNNRGGSTSFPRRFHQFLCVPSIQKFLHPTASNDRVIVCYLLSAFSSLMNDTRCISSWSRAVHVEFVTGRGALEHTFFFLSILVFPCQYFMLEYLIFYTRTTDAVQS
jgi:hypothetical protein